MYFPNRKDPMQQKLFKSLPMALSMVVATLAMQPAALAQQPPADRTSSVLLVSVKPDMLDEWTDLLKHEVLPALKKAGFASVTTNQTVLGNNYEFQIATPLDKMDVLDLAPALERGIGKEAAARLSAKLSKCTVSSRRYLATIVGSMSNPGPTDKVLPIRIYSRYRIIAGKTAEFENLFKTEFLPQYKKAGVSMAYGRRGFGSTGANEIVLITQRENFASMEGGPAIRKSMGDEAYSKLNAKALGLRVPLDTIIRRYRADLSY